MIKNSAMWLIIMKMNHWASIELKDIVERASICRKVKREYDIYEPESETTYECTVKRGY